MSADDTEIPRSHFPRVIAIGAAVVLLLALAWMRLSPARAAASAPALTGQVVAAAWEPGKPGRYKVWVRIGRRDGKPLRENPTPECVLLTDAATGEFVFHSQSDPVTEWWKRAPDGSVLDYYVEGTRSKNLPLPAALIPLVQETRTPDLGKRLAQWRWWNPMQFGPNQESGAIYPLLPDRVLTPQTAKAPDPGG